MIHNLQTGSLSLQRLTSNVDAVCTGGISDNFLQGGPAFDVNLALDNAGVFPAAAASLVYSQTESQAELVINIQGLPVADGLYADCQWYYPGLHCY